MAFATVEKPWQFSRHGFDVNRAKPGEVFEVTNRPTAPDQISEDLARQGEASGHLKLSKTKPKEK